MKVNCPKCKGSFQVEGQESGASFDCPFCETPFAFRDRETIILSQEPGETVPFEKTDSKPADQSITRVKLKLQEKEWTQAEDEGAPLPSTSSKEASHDMRNAETTKLDPNRPSPIAGETSKAQSVPAELTDLRVGDVIQGYKLEEVVGWGGMSVVFRALQLSLQRDVAIKVLRKDLCEDPEFTQRFLNEAQALAELSHPSIVQVFDQGAHKGNHYLVMEYVDGVSLRKLMQEGKTSIPQTLEFMPDLCAALEYAHSKGIVHRDIKPENLLKDKHGKVKVADFGLVRLIGQENKDLSRLTKTQTIMGTLEYMSPEQREGKRDIDHRADLYSLGVVFYELLTGELPIARFPLPSECAKLAPGIDQIVLKLLEKKREKRYQRASFISTDLRRVHSNPQTKIYEPKNQELHPGVERLLLFLQSPINIFATAIFITCVASNSRDDEFVASTVAIAFPFYFVRSICYGLIPRITLPKHHPISKYPFLLFAVAAFCILVISEGAGKGLRDGWWFLFCGTISLGVLLSFYKKQVFRQANESSHVAVQPNGKYAPAGPPSRSTPAPPPLPGSIQNVKELAKKRLQTGIEEISHHLESKLEGSIAKAEAKGNKSKLEEQAAAHAEKQKALKANEEKAEPPVRLSALCVLAFITSLLTLLYSLGIAVASQFDPTSWLFYIEMSYGDVAKNLRGIWELPYNSQVISNMVNFMGILLLLPLIVPIGFSLLSLIPLQSPKRRGWALIAITTCLVLFQSMLLYMPTKSVRSSVADYWRVYSDRSQISSTYEICQKATSVQTPISRMATYHAIARRNNPELKNMRSRDELVSIVCDKSLSPQERIGAVVLLRRIHNGYVFECMPSENDLALVDYVRATSSERNHWVKKSMRNLISPELTDLFEYDNH